ncbi:MAG: CBO0543 family protein, partial [Desulfocucumaceae bacterium]
YNFEWDFWDSYTWWWLFLLVFEYAGGLIVPEKDRKPIGPNTIGYGKAGWLALHFILIITIFLGGVYVGMVAK